MRHGGQILADQLRLHGVRRVFSVPGESFLAALDGLHGSGIANVVCRQEGGAAMMAEAQGKMTGEPGICFVTRGPGATNAAAGVHVARQDSTPLILFIGQIDTGHRDREAFQEVDFRAMFGPLAKWAAEIDSVERIPEYIGRAFAVATSGRPGPVVLALPEDMLSRAAQVPDRPGRFPRLAGDLTAPARLVMEALRGASRPLVVVGGPHWSADAAADLARFAEAQGLPVACSFRRQDYMDNRHPNYVGDLNVGPSPRLAARLREADALLVLGSRLGDIATQGYTLLDPRHHGKRLFHVHADPDEPGHVWRPEFAITAEAPAFVRALADLSPMGADWDEWTRAARADYDWWRSPQPTPGAVRQEEVIRWLSETLPEDAVLTNGAGNFAAFLHRYFVYKGYRTQLAPTSGSMGYGFPAAVAASLEHPGRVVVCVAGDGDFQMTLNEMSTAVQHGACPIVVVMNNGRYGTIRMHQERTYPGRVSGTDLANPDYAMLARAYGGHGETVTRGEDFPDALARARASGTVAVIECRVDSEALTPSQTLAAAREQGMRAQG
ncbi:thiamine pyrophosphate-binding protein [Rubellimicrobium arenae]|uniref:thiamine pyrophosphate-binding protein n=1 Tax=Rubellimicrobium arenae TaxID=2817372 RepID=UPI001B30B400|nr:thiamine pyrophosphate-binding protein [Rubellimicrobium arenae]